MGPRELEVAQRRGQRKLEAMKRRTGQLRRRVIATAIVGFAVLWTAVFVQMATGNDPVLGTDRAARPAARKKRAPGLERRSLQATAPPRSDEEEDDEGSPAIAEPEASEAAGIEVEQAEAERVEAEQIEIEQREAEARELEELEPVTTGQS
jgi:hypothetical protein